MSLALEPVVATPPRLRRYARHGLLTQLAAFATVMRVGSVTRAAETLCIAQPTLSGQLRKLEEALDVRLFVPCGRRLSPTPAAQVLLRAAEEVTRALERCESALIEVRRTGTGDTPRCAPYLRVAHTAPGLVDEAAG
ncbi:MAG: LysR family transcriptional regulator [Burkholderiaceae bacterium]